MQNNSRIPEIYIFFSFLYFFMTHINFSFEKLTWQTNYLEIISYFICIFDIKIRFSWILKNIFMNRIKSCQIIIFLNENNICKIKLWHIGIGIYWWSKYPRINLWWIYSETIRKIFANRELFAEHFNALGVDLCLIRAMFNSYIKTVTYTKENYLKFFKGIAI